MPLEEPIDTKNGDAVPTNSMIHDETKREQEATAATVEALLHASDEPQLSGSKTVINEKLVLSYVQSAMNDADIIRVESIVGGVRSQAFSFESKGESYVVRVNAENDDSFRKDEYISKRYGQHLPIPEVIAHGKIGKAFACITRKAEGVTLKSLPRDKAVDSFPSVIRMLDAIHTVPSDGEGFGWFDAEGKGIAKSWQDVVLYLEQNEYFDWPTLLADGRMEKDVYYQLMSELKRLGPQMPELHQLVHGDVGLGNAFIDDGGNITAIIDWDNAQYGDPLYDVAWLHVLWSDVDFLDAYKEHAMKRGDDMKNFDDRIRCYTASIGLACMGFNAKYSKPGTFTEEYSDLKQRLKKFGMIA